MDHPEHELLFVGSQVAKASGLKDPSSSIRNTKRVMSGHLCLSGLMDDLSRSLPNEANGHSLRTTTVLINESFVYEMLLRGCAPQSEPFRKWLTEEVLPTIRKTGKYNAEESSNPAVLRT